MKNTIKIFTILVLLSTAVTSAFAKSQDRLDQWLDRYNTFIEKLEKCVQNKQTSQIKNLTDEKNRLFKEKDRIQKEEGNFTFQQGLRYAELNTRWGVGIGALHATKGVKTAADSVNNALEE